MSRFSFYTVDSSYCDYLRQFDTRVPYTMDNKATRPFIGIVFNVDNIQYYAPLTSPKQKHLKMKNQVDFLKIDSGLYGAINFNNMIPIHTSSLSLVDMKISTSDTNEDVMYKKLLSNQLSWCNKNRDQILKKAKNLYQKYVNGLLDTNVKSRCCSFPLIEIKLKEYIVSNGLTQ